MWHVVLACLGPTGCVSVLFFSTTFFHAIDPFALWIDIFIYNKSTTWREKSYISRDFHQAVLFFCNSWSMSRSICFEIVYSSAAPSLTQDNNEQKQTSTAGGSLQDARTFANEKATLEASSVMDKSSSSRFASILIFNFSTLATVTRQHCDSWASEIERFHFGIWQQTLLLGFDCEKSLVFRVYVSMQQHRSCRPSRICTRDRLEMC